MGTLRLGKRTDNRSPRIADVLPLAALDDVVFGGWDLFDDNCYEAAKTAGVLDAGLLEQIRPELEAIKPWPAVFDRQYVKRLDGPNVKKGPHKKDLADQVIADIHTFKADHKLDRLVMVWCGSTEIFMGESPAHQSLAAFEAGLLANDVTIPSSMIYTYAALKEGIPFANGAPNLSCDIPAMVELAALTKTPIIGKDLKTGQTLIKTIIAPGLKARLLGVEGWYSTNILGNRDGEVLDDPESFKTKEESKKSVLDYIFQPHLYPDLYKEIHHVVRINYYPPRGDNKEGWDNVDLVGWLGYRCSSRSTFSAATASWRHPSCSTSRCSSTWPSAPACRASRSGSRSTSRARSTPRASIPEHDLFIQLMKLKNTMRWMIGEELITHLGREYYD